MDKDKVEVTLKGNFNIMVTDLGVEFTPHKRKHVFTKKKFEASHDIKAFLDKYLFAHELQHGSEHKHAHLDTKSSADNAVTHGTAKILDAAAIADDVDEKLTEIDATGASAKTPVTEPVVEKTAEPVVEKTADPVVEQEVHKEKDNAVKSDVDKKAEPKTTAKQAAKPAAKPVAKAQAKNQANNKSDKKSTKK